MSIPMWHDSESRDRGETPDYYEDDDEVQRLRADLERTAQERDTAERVSEARRQLMVTANEERDDAKARLRGMTNALATTDKVNAELLEDNKALRAHIAVWARGETA